MPKWDGHEEPIGQISALKRQDFRDMAQETLEKVYRYVLPIMQKRRYRVHKLVEFLPKNPNLLGLNVNHGQSISLRLRYHHNPKEFLSFENVLGTMLHELCHNVHGPHNADFFKLLDELTSEMEDMIARGYRGTPFMGSGQTLGRLPMAGALRPNNISRSPSPTATAASGNKTPYAGTKRLGRGRKLGGLGTRRKPTGDRSLRDLASDAAERRRQADVACKTARRMEDLANDERGEVIDLTGEDAEAPTDTGKEKEQPKQAEPIKPMSAKSVPPKSEQIDEIIYILDD